MASNELTPNRESSERFLHSGMKGICFRLSFEMEVAKFTLFLANVLCASLQRSPAESSLLEFGSIWTLSVQLSATYQPNFR